MLIKLTKSSPATGYITLVILCFILFTKEWFFGDGSSFVFENVVVAGITLLSSILLTITVRNQALSKNYVISGLLFVLFCFSDQFFGDVRLALKMFVAIFAFFCLLRSCNRAGGYVSLFNGTLLFSCISVFDPIFIFALPFVWITLLVYSDNNYRDWIISLIAIILPYLIYFSFYFLIGDLPTIYSILDIIFDLPAPSLPDWNNAFIMPVAQFIIGIIAFIQQIKHLRGDIIYRKKISLFLFAFVYFSLFAILFYAQSAAHIVLPIAAAFLIGKYFYYTKTTWIAEVLFWGLIIGALLL
jgi:hypothetical protein